MSTQEKGMGMSPWWILKVFGGLSLMGYMVFSLLQKPFFSPLFSLPLVVGQTVVVFGASFSLWHYALLKKNTKDFENPSHLVVRGGLFSWVRHPMYLGDMITLCGFFLMIRDPLSLALLAIGWISLLFQCKIEDQCMGKQFGETHQEWSKSTKLVLPGLY